MNAASRERRLDRRHAIGVILLFTALTAAATWPQIIQPGGIPAHRDAWFNMWRIAWIAHQLPRDPLHLFDANIHHPEPRTLAYSDAVLLQGMLATPFIRAGVPTPHVHTMLVLASFVLAGVGMWALVSATTGSTAGGIAAGIVFAFAPFRFDHFMHLEILWTAWMPLTLLAVHRTLARPSLGTGAAAGLLFAAQALSCIYHAVFMATILLPLATVLVSEAPAGRRGRAMASLAAGAVVAALVVLPYLTPYWQARSALGDRSAAEAQLYSAGPRHYLAATPDNIVYGRLSGRFGRDEKRLFPGVVAVALSAFALWPPFTRRHLAYAIGLLLALDLSFGPSGVTYDWLREYVPFYRGLRAPARAAAVVLLTLAVLTGLGWARLERVWQQRRWPAIHWVTAAALAVMLAECAIAPRSLIAAPLRAGPLDVWLAAQPATVVAEFPMPDEHTLPGHDAEYAYRSTFHWHRLVNGYSGNVPASYVETLRAVHAFPSDRALERLRAIGVGLIVLHEELYGTDAYRDAIAGLDARPDVRRRATFGRDGNESAVYELTPPGTR